MLHVPPESCEVVTIEVVGVFGEWWSGLMKVVDQQEWVVGGCGKTGTMNSRFDFGDMVESLGLVQNWKSLFIFALLSCCLWVVTIEVVGLFGEWWNGLMKVVGQQEWVVGGGGKTGTINSRFDFGDRVVTIEVVGVFGEWWSRLMKVVDQQEWVMGGCGKTGTRNSRFDFGDRGIPIYTGIALLACCVWVVTIEVVGLFGEWCSGLMKVVGQQEWVVGGGGKTWTMNSRFDFADRVESLGFVQNWESLFIFALLSCCLWVVTIEVVGLFREWWNGLMKVVGQQEWVVGGGGKTGTMNSRFHFGDSVVTIEVVGVFGEWWSGLMKVVDQQEWVVGGNPHLYWNCYACLLLVGGHIEVVLLFKERWSGLMKVVGQQEWVVGGGGKTGTMNSRFDFGDRVECLGLVQNWSLELKGLLHF
uniref:Transmembrane protein n=1 Tax=Tanacetum cinerariifolium TaxID=118510 RepID=A0A6L2P1Z6_TANCI|nr:hypothetical protein [Tanacetum cinerariifolium]